MNSRKKFSLGHPLLGLAMAALVCAQVRAQDKYGVLVGVEAYSAELTMLDFPNEDARDTARSLEALGFKTKVLTSDAQYATSRPSTPAVIAMAIKTMANSCGNGDTLIVGLSGHAVQFSDDPLLPSGVRETYFCPQNATFSDRNSLLPISELVEFMNDSSATRKLLLVDACRNSVLSPEATKKAGIPKLESNPVHENRRVIPGGMSVLFSCSSGQFSWEHKELNHSVFSHFVTQYLDGKAEPRFYDGRQLDLDGLVYFVRKKTNEFVYEKNLSPDGQLPVLRGSSANWSLGKIIEREITNSIGMNLKLVTAGTFVMGSPEGEADRLDDELQHRVTLSRDFYLGQFEATQGEFERVLGFNPSRFTGSDRLPVENVSWFDAIQFCNRLSELEGRDKCYRLTAVEKGGDSIKAAKVELISSANGYRLPTESQWEYACRAGTTSAFHFGTNITPGNVNYNGNYPYAGGSKGLYRETTIKAGTFSRPNAFGLEQMHGNVSEWCWDFYGEYPRGGSIDPLGSGLGSSRVYRGGSWSFNARRCRSAFRLRYAPDSTFGYLGFRVALVPDK